MIRVLVVHKARLIANIIASVLSEEENIYVVGTAITIEEALGKLKMSRCNMVLVAATLENDNALRLTKSVAVSYPDTKVLVIGVPKSEDVILQYVVKGTSDYVLQNVPVERLLDHMPIAYDDELISPGVAAVLMERIVELSQIASQFELEPQVVAALATRERDILNLIGDGMTNQEIANQLVIEASMVKNHVHNILEKLDVSSREKEVDYLPILDDDQTD